MRYNAERDQIEISVRELCAMALSRGSIDSRRSHGNLYERAREGARFTESSKTPTAHFITQRWNCATFARSMMFIFVSAAVPTA